MMIAIIRLRGNAKMRTTIESTLQMLNLKTVNNCTVIPDTKIYRGMLQNAKDFITFGPIKKEVFEQMLLKWGRTADNGRLTDSYLKEKKFDITKFMDGKMKLKDAGIKPVFRLHPPRGGHKGGIKKPVSMKGSLGDRKEKINDLLLKMI
ncbi:MAG: 50S ribosomal protein L30 [Candidatus Micrarchaeota archaeon]